MKPASELRQYYEILRRHVAIIGLVVAIAVGGIGLQMASQARQYQADVSVLVTPQVFGGSSDGSPNLAAFQSEYRTLVMNDILYLAKSSEVMRRVAQQVPGVGEADLYRAVTVKSLPNTDILLISARDTQRARAALIANTATEQLVQYYVELNQAAAASTRKFIAQQVTGTQQKLRAAEDQLAAFQTRTNIVDLPAATSHLIQRSFDLQAMYNAALLDQKASQQRADAIRERLRSERDGQLATVDISTNPVVSQLRDRLIAAEADLASLRQVYTDQHPKVQQALGTITDLRARIRQEASKAVADQSAGVSPIREQLVQQLVGAQVDGTVAQARAAAITPLLGQLQAGLSTLPANELTFARLQRDVKLNQDLFMRLSSLYQDATISEQKAGFTGQAALVMVDQTAPSPVSLQLPLKAGLAGLLGLIMGCVLALLVDTLDNRVRTPREAEGAFGVPVLASVPTMSPKNHQSLMGQPGVVGLVLPFVLPFFFMMIAGVLIGLLVSRAVPVVGGVAGHAAAVSGQITAAVVEMLHRLSPHLG
jgi:succinoglycan biosynthesis transport protein ExoP